MKSSEMNIVPTEEGGPVPRRLLVRIVRRKVLSKKMEWYSGLVLDKVQEQGKKKAKCSFLDEQVDVLLIGTVIRKGSIPLPAIADITVERREEGRNKRGALVLHAVNVNSIKAVPEEKDCEDGHERETEGKEERNRIFAAWLIDNWGTELLGAGTGVIDVAGGRGTLSVELAQQGGNAIRCTLVEPRTYKNRNNDNSLIEIVQEKFNDDFVNTHTGICKNASFFVGMHPDQATESIVDIAFRLNVPFAIVPCCVYPTLFPDRKLSTGQGVKRYNSFLQYLREKDPRILQTSLPFLGRNKVLYWLPEQEKRQNQNGKRICKHDGDHDKKRKKTSTSSV